MKTTLEYTNTLPLANGNKPLFVESIKTALSGFVDNYNVLESITQRYDIDNAVGQQLDVLGEWIGISRKFAVPLDIYFSLDSLTLGFGSGLIKGPFDPAEGLAEADDENYRLILKSKIAANHWDGTFESAQQIISLIYANFVNSKIFLIDNYDMTFSLVVSGALPNALLLTLLQQRYFFLKPSGVRIHKVYTTSVNNTPVFGLDLNNAYIGGFDIGAIAI